ncbi:MAG TPA: TMEM14 family protein [Ignavibacteria bacterium]|nr:TMEM14 family protein [Ignavibacteria bacterium]HRF65386.1 TMEM14 family protein [Ignavibacteria bacterium]HRJ04263.1 TMEM14 family protein [Ignavibacteria bacterium]
MIQNHIIMIVNAVILIALGVYGYFSSGSPTALIAPGIGLVLFILSFPTKKDNHVAAHIAVGLTLVAAITFIIIGIRRANPMVIAMGVITFLCFDLYILNFILRKKKREANKLPE